MRYIKKALLMIFASMTLVACGGGTDTPTVDLKAVLASSITTGMTYNQVRDVVGYEYNVSQTPTLSKWSSGSGNTLETLSVPFVSGLTSGTAQVTDSTGVVLVSKPL